MNKSVFARLIFCSDDITSPVVGEVASAAAGEGLKHCQKRDDPSHLRSPHLHTSTRLHLHTSAADPVSLSQFHGLHRSVT